MKENIKALLVQARPHACDALRLALEEQLIEVSTADNCFEAALNLCSDCPPHLVFTDIQLPDGDWADVLSFAASANAPVNVIVVSPRVDVPLYIQTMEHGAFDFIVSPPSVPELLHVLQSAAENVSSRRHQAAAIAPPDSLVVAPLSDALKPVASER
jgi:DNA-binding NtrC family response regulator